jgi:hypothetical protein
VAQVVTTLVVAVETPQVVLLHPVVLVVVHQVLLATPVLNQPLHKQTQAVVVVELEARMVVLAVPA